jgi:hypothetical protein
VRLTIARVLAAGAAYFAAVFAAGFVLGVGRTLVLAPWLGETGAVLLELPLILAWSWWVAGRIVRRWPLPGGAALASGGLAFALLMAAEAGVSTQLAGRGLADHWALYAEPAHQLGLAGQLLFAALPWWRVRNAAQAGRR